MGFWDRWFGEKEPVRRMERIEFSGLGKWIAEKRAALAGKSEDDAEGIALKIRELAEVVKKRVAELEAEKIGDGVHQRLKSTVSSSRDNYASTIRKQLDKACERQDLLRFSDGLEEALGTINRVDMRYGERAKMGFPDGVARVKKELKKLAVASNDLNGLLEGKRDKLMLLRGLDDGVALLDRLLADLRSLEDRRATLSDEIKALERERSEAEKTVDRMEHGKRAKEADSLESKLVETKAKRQELESFMLNVLGPLRRLFKKYSRLVKDARAAAAAKYAEDPVGTYLRGGQDLPELLARVQKAIQTGIMNLDAGEGGKAIKKIRAISFSNLEKARSEYNETVSTIRGLELRLGELSVGREVGLLQSGIKDLERKRASALKQADRLDGDIDDKKEEIDEERESLEKRLSNFTECDCELVIGDAN